MSIITIPESKLALVQPLKILSLINAAWAINNVYNFTCTGFPTFHSIHIRGLGTYDLDIAGVDADGAGIYYVNNVAEPAGFQFNLEAGAEPQNITISVHNSSGGVSQLIITWYAIRMA